MVQLSNGKKRKGHVIRREKALLPKVIETHKSLLLIRGQRSGDQGKQLLQDLHKLKNTTSKLFSKKNEIFPFDDETKIQFLCQKNDAGLFAFTSSNKKRPNNLVLGRTFDNQILDMFEFGVFNFRSLQSFVKENKTVKATDTPTCIIFQGLGWEESLEMRNLKLFFLDFFKGVLVTELDLAMIDHVIVLTFPEKTSDESIKRTIKFRSYVVGFKRIQKMKKLTTNHHLKDVKLVKELMEVKVPRTQLIEMGPRFDLSLRRKKTAAPSLMEVALKQSEKPGKAKIKNMKKDKMLSTVGQIHMNTEGKKYYHRSSDKKKLDSSFIK
eukprot:snap_masked-scaffold_1-processed-gene-20.22-mRNA-1 protein AED:0.03 eAED:0.03 QI:0/0/0/0.5/1/1/2/0/323